jgi:hypothetical protein
MSILNTAEDGMPEILDTILNVLRNGDNSYSEDELINTIAPFNMNQHRIKETLNTFIDLQLFKREKGRIIIDKDYSKYKDESNRKIVSRVIMSPKNNATLSKPDNWEKAQDFTKMCAFLSILDVFNINPLTTESFQILEKESCRDIKKEKILQNEDRLPGFHRWAGYLGFGWDYRDKSQTKLFNYDPTQIVHEYLNDIFDGNEEMGLDQFLQRTSELIPVLNMGIYFNIVRNNLDKEKVGTIPTQCTPVMELVILTLESMKKVKLSHVSDSPHTINMPHIKQKYSKISRFGS